MRNNLLTHILRSFLALALLASTRPAQSTESTKGTQPAATPKTTKTKISAKKAALVDINSASQRGTGRATGDRRRDCTEDHRWASVSHQEGASHQENRV